MYIIQYVIKASIILFMCIRRCMYMYIPAKDMFCLSKT